MTKDEAWLLEEKYQGKKTEGFFADVERLKSGEPLAYIIGHLPFLNTKICLDSKPLIPRTETEYWIEKVIHEIQNRRGLTPTIRVLDLCAGSGCIGVALLTEIDYAHVDFAEIDEMHHSSILKNIVENNIDVSRTNILGGDLFERVTEKYDYILTNPPYIDPILDRSEEAVRKFEPHEALYGGTGGLEIIVRIIEKASNFLTPDGALYIEHEPEQTERIVELAKPQSFASTTYTDQYNTPRYTKFTRNSR